jgi:hypothetical protein
MATHSQWRVLALSRGPELAQKSLDLLHAKEISTT